METNYEIRGNRIITEAFEANFEHNIETAIWYDGVYTVLLSPTDENGNIMEELVNNVYGVSSHGIILWQIDPEKTPSDLWPFEDDEISNALFTGITLSPDGIKVTTFCAMQYTLEHKTGRILKKEAMCW